MQVTCIQEEEIRMSINLLYVEDTIEKLRRILRCYKMRLTSYTESALRNILCKPKDPVATEDKTAQFMKLAVVTANLNGI